MALDQLKAFLLLLQDDEAVKQSVLAASTADDVAKIAQEWAIPSAGTNYCGSPATKWAG
ncbi:hypothetical protein WH7805_01732 [Synechococcus sp. WH 7805]|nr:hypothetical protein WH7805_01732 [Synechococcus sp. WH 7805]